MKHRKMTEKKLNRSMRGKFRQPNIPMESIKKRRRKNI